LYHYIKIIYSNKKIRTFCPSRLSILIRYIRYLQWQRLLFHPRSVRNWENAAIIITLLLLLPCIDMGIREKNTRSKMLQTNAIGMSTRIYWIPTYIIDFLLYAFSIIFFGIIILSVYHPTLHFSNLEIGKNFKICSSLLIFQFCFVFCILKFIKNQCFFIFRKFCSKTVIL